MKLDDFAHIVETKKGFDEAVVSVLKAADKKGWAIFSVYDVQERLAAKGFSQGKLKIIEICSAKHADAFLRKNRYVSLCMPCKINVLEEGKRVFIAGMKPGMLPEFFPEVTKEEAVPVEKELVEIIENAR